MARIDPSLLGCSPLLEVTMCQCSKPVAFKFSLEIQYYPHFLATSSLPVQTVSLIRFTVVYSVEIK
jgi:hypothetical protein